MDLSYSLFFRTLLFVLVIHSVGVMRVGGAETPRPEFSFLYSGQPSSSFLDGWTKTETRNLADPEKVLETRVFRDPKNLVQVTCQSIHYSKFAGTEWVLIFENVGKGETAIIEEIQTADFRLAPRNGANFTLQYAEGSHERITDFQPMEVRLQKGTKTLLAPDGGRSSDGVLPYFDLQHPKGGGLIFAVGWTGQWAASFDARNFPELRISAGLEKARFKLYPGEKVRMPSVLVLRYPGESIQGHNLFRRLMVAHYTPNPNGKPLRPPVAASGATIGFNNVSETNQVLGASNINKKNLPVDIWWIDAGWSRGGFPLGMGNWDPELSRFPRGLAPVGKRVEELGLDFLVWFEPERVMTNTWLRLKHADWLLAPSNLPPAVAYQKEWRLLNLGNPEALNWAKTNFSAVIREARIDIYRHDFNMHPLYYWRASELPDRQGLNEIRHITGLYEYLDYLQRENPGLLVDNVASGGRRLDFEMMRRSVPLLRTDYLWDPVGAQCMTHALSLWLPMHGQGGVSANPYDFRSGMGSFVVYAFDFYNLEANFWPALDKQIRDYRKIQKYFSADFYPLTPYTTNLNTTVAWQFHQPESGEGIVQGFRRPQSQTDALSARLLGLSPGTTYSISSWDDPEEKIVSGKELMEKGLSLTFPTQPSSLVLSYRPKLN